MNLYFVSGLGVDKRVFQKLIISSVFSIHHIEWIDPSPGESISKYARRLCFAIDTKLPFILIGLSLAV